MRNQFPRRQNGAMLVMAVFVIVVFAVVSASSISILGSTEISNAHEVQSARSYLAAQSGLEREMQRLFPRPLPGTPQTCATTAGGASWSMNFSDLDGLRNCTASITCSDFEADSFTFYKISSTGTCGGSSRSLTMTARSI